MFQSPTSTKKLRICVFGSSSSKTKQSFCDVSYALGTLIAQRNLIVVNGGGGHGVMGAVNKGARAYNGEIIGVIHKQFCVDTDEDKLITNMIRTDGNGLDERKQLLLDNSDCIIIMPGGCGTFDEFWDAISSKSLGMKNLNNKPICVVNVEGFYDGFIQQLKAASLSGLLYAPPENYFKVFTDPKDALDFCQMECSKVNQVNNIDDNRIKVRSDSSSSSDKKNVTRTFTLVEVTLILIIGVLTGAFITKFASI